MTQPLCPGGARPKNTAPALIVAGSAALATFLCGRAPALCPFISAVAAIAAEPAVMCSDEPPPLPVWTAQDVAGLVSGQSTVKLVQTIDHYLWFEYCECIGSTTPPATTFVPPSPMPTLSPVAVQACDLESAALTASVVATQVIPPVGQFPLNQHRPLPTGATHFRLRGSIDELAAGFDTVQRRFYMHWQRADFTSIDEATPRLALNAATRRGEVVATIPTGAAYYRTDIRFNDPLGPVPTGEKLSTSLEVFCGSAPGSLQQECCPPDAALWSLLDNLLLKVNLLVERVGPVEPLEQLSSLAISGEGVAGLVLGARMIKIQIDTPGLATQLVPYANPDRLMRAGTIRFGNDFGWRRREHVDSVACLFPIPPDAQVVSWSLSPGTLGSLLQLGEPRLA